MWATGIKLQHLYSHISEIHRVRLLQFSVVFTLLGFCLPGHTNNDAGQASCVMLLKPLDCCDLDEELCTQLLA